MMRKKIVSLCMALALCLGLLPVTALAVDAPNNLYVGNQNVKSGEDTTYWTTNDSGALDKSNEDANWTVRYNPNTATLTLKSATIKTTSNIGTSAVIYAQSNSQSAVSLTIELDGRNTIECDSAFYGIYVDAEMSNDSYGTDASLTITGNGSLEVSGSFNGIVVKSGSGNASLTINNASVVAKTTQTHSGYAGVYVQSSTKATGSPQLSLAVNGGSLTTSASEGNDGIQFYVGASQASKATTSLTVSDNAIVRANGGIKASRVDEPTPSGTGIVFDGTEGTVYGGVTLDESLTINQGETLTIPEGSTLTVPEDKILTNNGTIDNSGTLTNNGTVTNNGTLNVNEGGKLEGETTGGSGTVVNTPTITAQPANQTVTAGNTATFTVTATSENLTYQWSQSTDQGESWREITGATGSTYTTAATTTSMSGYQYRCEVSNSAGSVTSNAVTLTVNDPAPTTYTITADVDPVEAGTVTVNGSGTSDTVTANSDVTLTATANDGYRFTGWMENDRQVSTDATYTFKATGDRTLTAKFEKKVTGVTLNTETLELFTGGSATLTATVEPSDAANQNVTWQSDNANVATVEGGTVTARGAGEATITVTTEDGEKTATCTVTVTRPYIPPANPNYKITVAATQGGAVTADPTAAKAGTTVTLTPSPDAGYQVGTVAVTDRFGEPVAVTEQADGTYTFTMPNGQVTVTVTFEQAPLPFHDVAEGDWFYDAVRYAYETGLMDGVGDNLFAPNSETTRAQLVTILYRLAGEPEPGGGSGFSDVAAGTWYTDAVAWAAENGIVNGTTDTTFAPGEDITREQLVTVLYRYAESKGNDVSASADLSGYPDAGQVQDYAQPAMAWAVAEGIVEGMDGNLNPAGNATRAQIATILMRFCEGVAK